MKQNLNLLLVFVILSGLLGCSTPQKTLYTSLATVGMSVDKAMQAAATATVAGKMSQADWAKVADIHGRFLVAYRTAVDAAKLDYTKASTNELLGLSAEIISTVNTILAR